MSSPQARLDAPRVRSGPAVAFPGQGVVVAELRKALHRCRDHDLVKQLAGHFSVADFDAIDFGTTDVSQPCTFVTGYIAAIEAFDPDEVPLVLGHSLGEITALTFAGAIDPDEALNLVLRRGVICRAVQCARPGQMIAVMGLDLSTVEWVRRRAIGATGRILEVASFNGATQTVLSGDVETTQAAIRLVAEAEGLAQILPIGGAFHSPLMLEAVDRFAAAVAAVNFVDPRTPLLSAVDGRMHHDVARLPDLIVRSLLLPVRWTDAARAARELGIEAVWDAGPGTTLQKLGRRDRTLNFVTDPKAVAQPTAIAEVAS
jgi:[acyl-carrier-protein] S-malonyltransferase